jgi:hypothetical protein
MMVRCYRSVPPYMIVNRCKDVIIRLRQADVKLRPSAGVSHLGPWEGWDEVLPNAGQPMPFAWDEPNGRHIVRVLAHAASVDARQLSKAVRDKACPAVSQLGPLQGCMV